MADVSPTPNPSANSAPAASAAKRRGFPASSIFFFALSIVLGGLAILLATGRIGTSSPPPPPPTPGDVEQVHVVNALEAQGLDVVETESGLFVPRGALSEVGQGMRVEGEPIYVFIFDDPEQARAEFAAVDPNEVLPPQRDGDAVEAVGAQPVGVTGGAPFLVQGSNVVVAMPGGDEEIRSKVRIAIEGLP